MYLQLVQYKAGFKELESHRLEWQLVSHNVAAPQFRCHISEAETYFIRFSDLAVLVGVERLIELRSATTKSRDYATRWRQSCVELATRRKTTTEHQRRRIDFFVPVNVVSTGAAESSPPTPPLKHLCTTARSDVVRRSTAAKGSSRLLSSTTNFIQSCFLCCCCCSCCSYIFQARFGSPFGVMLLFMNFFAKIRWII